MRGQFALMVLAEVDDGEVALIVDEAKAAGEKIGLNVTVIFEEDEPASCSGGLSYRLKTFAMDQPGIVHRITHLLHDHHVNIEELQTRLEPGSYRGTPQFSMQMCITIPAELSIEQLRGELEVLCESLNCNLEIEPAD
jgi:glycine cleavage system regulatory protein